MTDPALLDAETEAAERALEEAIDRFQRELDAMPTDAERERAVALLTAKFVIEIARLPV